jgi:hypothetical protein
VILITGATGSSGLAVIREFARNKVAVRALVRNSRKARELWELPTVDVVVGDMRRPATLGAAFDGVDRALMISSAGPEMLEMQCTLVDAAKRAGVRWSVHGDSRHNPCPFRPWAVPWAKQGRRKSPPPSSRAQSPCAARAIQSRAYLDRRSQWCRSRRSRESELVLHVDNERGTPIRDDLERRLGGLVRLTRQREHFVFRKSRSLMISCSGSASDG